MGWTSYKIENHLKLTLCYKCQGFGHIAKFCQSEVSCAHCTSSEHESRNCDKKIDTTQLRCTNCIRAKFRNINYATTDKKCPVYRKSMEEFEDRIDFDFN